MIHHDISHLAAHVAMRTSARQGLSRAEAAALQRNLVDLALRVQLLEAHGAPAEPWSEFVAFPPPQAPMLDLAPTGRIERFKLLLKRLGSSFQTAS
ncbi:MAG: hypothetical protein ACE5EM_01305 [Sphingomonadales bacterium]